MRTLHTYLNGRRIGTLSEGDDLRRFEYDAAWTDAPDGFDLSPALNRATPLHADGSSQSPVQWYSKALVDEELDWCIRDYLRESRCSYAPPQRMSHPYSKRRLSLYLKSLFPCQ